MSMIRFAAVAAIAAVSSVPHAATAQTSSKYYARSVVQRTDQAPAKQYPGSWSVKLQTNSLWGECANGVMTTSNVTATCDGGDCDPTAKPTTMTETCGAKTLCRTPMTAKGKYLNCAGQALMNGSYSQSQAAAFCSRFANAVGCGVLTGSQVQACLGSGQYTPNWANNTSANSCG